MITLNPDLAVEVLLVANGWQDIQAGTLTIDSLQLAPAAATDEAEDYGFTFINGSGQQVTGRLSALLAITEVAE